MIVLFPAISLLSNVKCGEWASLPLKDKDGDNDYKPRWLSLQTQMAMTTNPDGYHYKPRWLSKQTQMAITTNPDGYHYKPRWLWLQTQMAMTTNPDGYDNDNDNDKVFY